MPFTLDPVVGLLHGSASWQSLQCAPIDSQLMIRLPLGVRFGPVISDESPLVINPDDQTARKILAQVAYLAPLQLGVWSPSLMTNRDDIHSNPWETELVAARRRLRTSNQIYVKPLLCLVGRAMRHAEGRSEDVVGWE